MGKEWVHSVHFALCPEQQDGLLGTGTGGKGWKSEGSTMDTTRKRLERPWTTTRTMEVLRWCPLAIAQRLVHCTIAVSTAVLGQSQRQCLLHCCWGTTWSERSPIFAAQLHLPAHDLFWDIYIYIYTLIIIKILKTGLLFIVHVYTFLVIMLVYQPVLLANFLHPLKKWTYCWSKFL